MQASRCASDLCGRAFGDKCVAAQNALNSSDSDESLGSLSGTISAHVGETLRVVYALRAMAGRSTGLWNADATQNGRSEVSNYGSSAYLYFAAADPSIDIILEGESGYDYALPAVVPVPAAVALLAPGLLLMLGFRRRP